MAKKAFNNVRHLISTPGTGTLTLGSVPTGWQSFSAAGAVDGDQPPYELRDGDAWENGYLTLGGSVTTATRTVIESSNSDTALDLSGSAVLTCVPLASSINDDVVSFVRTQSPDSTAKGIAQTNLGMTATGKALATAMNAADARDTIGATTVGSDLITAANAAAAQTAVGMTATGKALATAADAAAARSAIGLGEFGFINRIINPRGSVAPVTPGSISDGAMSAMTSWFSLTQSNPVTEAASPFGGPGVYYMMAQTQSNASAQRHGRGQWLEFENVIDLRGQSVTLSAQVAHSSSTTIRYAILEWTGTADAPTRDVVNDWTSGTFTTGNFFKSTSLAVVATGSLSATSVFTRISLSGSVSTSMNNLGVFFWTDATQATGTILYLSEVQLERGATMSPFARRSIQDEINLCGRYVRVIIGPALVGVVMSGIGPQNMQMALSPRMFRAPDVYVINAISITTGVTSGTITASTTNYSSTMAVNFKPSCTGSFPTAGLPVIAQGDGAIVLDATFGA
jgi:hypothetical protein